METSKIGKNAGIIWELVDENGCQYVEEIKKKTKFDSESLFMALGWLAREKKIIFDNLDGKFNITILY